ncbi:iron chaperone [Kribbella sp. CA-247076]|uniref:iron chaperone n=1 Tax=Kribbella sp. CA-247076 TaxID=3239941 RepID=UPI003D94A0EA
MAENKFTSVDEYIASFPADVREVLEEVRRTVRAVVPDAGEKISYQIPTITLGGKYLLYFSAWKEHLSIYPIPPVDEELAAALEPYRSGKGTLKFPLNNPIPYNLITRLTEAFVTERGGQRT